MSFDPSEDMATMVCMPVSARFAEVAEGSTKEACCHCNTPVWVTPASRQIVVAIHHQFICHRCSKVVLPPGKKPQPPTEAQMAEIRKMMRK